MSIENKGKLLGKYDRLAIASSQKLNCATNLQHLSQKNLSSAFKVSVELKFLRQLVIELFCSISRLKSRNVSSLAVTVSQHKHRVSFVNIPWKVISITINKNIQSGPKAVNMVNFAFQNLNMKEQME